MAKVLLVTNHAGFLHITPISNKSDYQAFNLRVPEKQYKYREIEEDEAIAYVEKHGGKDPSFKTAKQSNDAIAEKDAEIAQLRAQLEKQKADVDNKTEKPESKTTNKN